jgi:osmoprotectant transport system ATP-binding protein
VVDDENRPQGWLALTGVSEEALHGPVTPDLLNLGGTLATFEGTLRAALDAALSSPSGRGVVVDADERFLGTVSASQVLARIEEQASAARTARSTLAVGSEA